MTIDSICMVLIGSLKRPRWPYVTTITFRSKAGSFAASRKISLDGDRAAPRIFFAFFGPNAWDLFADR
jgi:hypothetical protein